MRKHTRFKAEIWKPVVGYEGYYEVSSHGRVRSVDRKITDTHGRKRMYRGKILVLQPDPSGYRQVVLSVGQKRRYARVHRLVLEAFIGPCPEGYEACHKNGDKGDNRLGNLRWDSRSENNLDRVRQGTCFNSNKRNCPRGHPLSGPNLVPAMARNGNRSCLSCARARDRVRRYPALKPDIQQISDSYYEQIMGRADV